ncbi:MAG: glycosyltransferase [Muribaculum sp.]|nr:glycosyltransferase [Muribaculum sp.]
MIDKKPLITVGIPVYNAEKFVAIAIRSVLNQSFTDFELLITDDGSSDNTVDIIDSFNDERIRFIKDGENKGISYRLNQQISLAKGEYFCRMDADDIMLPWRLQKQVEYLLKNPNVDVIGGGALIIDDENNIIGKRLSPIEFQLTLDMWKSGHAFMHPTVFGKTKFFRKFKYRKDLVGVEDLDLWYRASKESIMFYIPDLVMCYREPLSLKLKTYLFRQKQTRLFLRKQDVRSSIGSYNRFKRQIMSYIKSFIAIIACLTHSDSKFIMRRNSYIDKNSSIFMNVNSFIQTLEKGI